MFKKRGGLRKILGAAAYLIVSVIAGIAAWIVGELLFERLTEKLFTPLGILLYFLIFFVILSIGLILLLVRKRSRSQLKKSRRSSFGLLSILLVVFLLITGGFEYLYELGDSIINKPTSYIFLIDDSSSMEGTEASRVKAISDIMNNNPNMPYAVYKFSSYAQLLAPMHEYSQGDEDGLLFESKGGTNIIGSIDFILSDIDSGTITGQGACPRVILLSDGDEGASEWTLGRTLNNCRDHNVTVCSVGFKNGNERYLKNIANQTGGAYVYCDEADKLGSAMQQAITKSIDRNLLSERMVYNHETMYAVLRILFLSLMGILWSVLKSLLNNEEKSFSRIAFILYVVLCTLGAFAMEFGTAAGLSAFLMRLVFDVLWALSIGTFPKKESPIPDTSVNGPQPVTVPGTFGANVIGSEEKSDGELHQLGANNIPGAPAGGNNGGNSGSGFFNQQKSSGNNSGNGFFNSDKGTADGGVLNSKSNNSNSGFFGDKGKSDK